MTKIAAAALVLTVAFSSPVLAQGGGRQKAQAAGKHDKTEVVRRTKAENKVTGEKYEVKRDHSGRVVSAKAKGKGYEESYQVRRDRYGNVVSESYKRKGGAPSFCRSGAGHPVYGRAWCVQKGFGLGNARWDRATWSDVVFSNRRTSSVGDVLGSIILGRVTNYAAQRLGLSSPLTGTWLVNSRDRTVYLVRSGSTPVAEFVDTNYDGRADYVLLHSR